MARVGTVAYQLELPPELSEVHNVFHISQLKRYILPPEKRTDMAEIELAKDLPYEEKPIRILDQTERGHSQQRNKVLQGSVGASQ